MGLGFSEMLTILQTNLAINSKKTEMKKMAKSMVHFKDSKVKGGPSLSSSQLPQAQRS